MVGVGAVQSSYGAAAARASSGVESVEAGRGLVLPVTVQTASAQEFAAIADNVKASATAGFGLTASLPLSAGAAQGPAAAAKVIEVYSEADFAAEVAHFLSQPGLRLAML
jgi:hypothetical protein